MVVKQKEVLLYNQIFISNTTYFNFQNKMSKKDHLLFYAWPLPKFIFCTSFPKSPTDAPPNFTLAAAEKFLVTGIFDLYNF